MIDKTEANAYCTDLSPPDAERAIQFNTLARDESIIAYNMFIEQKKLARKIFIEGYNAIYASAALFLAKKYRIKLDAHQGKTHKNMRLVLEFYTRDNQNQKKLLNLYENAIEKFEILNQQYSTAKYFARKVIKDLINERYNQGKKVTYYPEPDPGRKDPIILDISDAKEFINNVINPFLFLMEQMTND